MKNTQQKERLQWHPAFYAGLQIELCEEAEYLIFENEHQLGTKPLEIDVLVVKKENLWLKSLTNHLKKNETAEKLLYEFSKHKTNKLYGSVLSIIMTANPDKFKEVKSMIEPLMDLMKDELEAQKELGFQLGIKQGIMQGINQGVKLIIETYQEDLGLTREEAQNKICIKFAVSQDTAKQYIAEYWK